MEELDLSSCSVNDSVLHLISRHCPCLASLYLEHDAGFAEATAAACPKGVQCCISQQGLAWLANCRVLQVSRSALLTYDQ